MHTIRSKLVKIAKRTIKHVCSFICLLLRAEIQHTVDVSARAQGEEGNW